MDGLNLLIRKSRRTGNLTIGQYLSGGNLLDNITDFNTEWLKLKFVII